MNRTRKAGVIATTAVAVLGFSAVLASAAGDTDDHYSRANTVEAGTATGTPTLCPSVGRPAGTVTCFSVPGQRPTLTVYCSHSTAGGRTPATGLGLFPINPLPAFNDGGTAPCLDSLGGTETTAVSQGSNHHIWQIGEVDKANDETTEAGAGDSDTIIVPQASVKVHTSQGCLITVAPSADFTISGTAQAAYDDNKTLHVAITNLPVIVTKLMASCPLPAGVPLKTTFYANYVFSPAGLFDAS